jgi:hypothetical protein
MKLQNCNYIFLLAILCTILTVHNLQQKWSSSNIANESTNRDCPPPQTRYALIRYTKYTIKAIYENVKYFIVCYCSKLILIYYFCYFHIP